MLCRMQHALVPPEPSFDTGHAFSLVSLGIWLATWLWTSLGSTAYTADPITGRRWTSLRYAAALRPWGEGRYTEGAAPTEFHFTGQRELSALGLHFYCFTPAGGCPGYS
jgi:hypothetical protein